jgi:hypothetical protein
MGLSVINNVSQVHLRRKGSFLGGRRGFYSVKNSTGIWEFGRRKGLFLR